MKNLRRKIIATFSIFALLFSVFLTSAEASYSQNNTQIKTEKIDTEAYLPSNVRIDSRLWELLFGNGEEETSVAEDELTLIPGGSVFGAKIKQSYISVQDPKNVKGLEISDKILEINGCKIHSVDEMKKSLSDTDKNFVNILIDRKGKQIELSIPIQNNEGVKSLGIAVTDGSAGIGTITFINPKTGEFGGLGHGICSPESQDPMEISGGLVTGVVLGGVHKGEIGKPGELSGILTDRVYGTLKSNTPYGVFGKLNSIPEDYCSLKVAKREEVKAGEATIYSTVKNGRTMEFKVKLSEIDKNSKGTKCFKIKVEDPMLLAMSGGIVRGMSGSPIIQDGKIIGAVTHVLINDPTSGYGIFIENMLEHS